MVNLTKRIAAFVQLGHIMYLLGKNARWPGYGCGLNEEEYDHLNLRIQTAKIYNGWFTEENVRLAFAAWGTALTEEKINFWLQPYRKKLEEVKHPKQIGVIMAGNIPLVGFHDLLVTCLSGHRFVGKMSGQDDRLLPALVQLLFTFEPDWKESIRLEQNRLKNVDAIIATGSNNSARYFEHYFGSYPNVIRKNRSSLAILTGNECMEELEALGSDIFNYYGLGCRSVTKLYLPQGYDLNRIFGAIYSWKEVVNHQKYGNNYDYHKALLLMNRDEIMENGFLLMKEDQQLVSPVGTMYYEYYDDLTVLRAELKQHSEAIQCIVSQEDTPFGQAQQPQLWDYADGVDTLQFLSDLN